MVLVLLCTGCSNQKSSSNSATKSSISTTKQTINGYWESDSEDAPTLEIKDKDVFLGVAWHRVWTDESGIFENVAVLNNGQISGKDSDSGENFVFKYEMKSDRLVITVVKNWLPSIFKDSSDKEGLTYKEGQTFIYNKTEKKEESNSKEESSSKEESKTNPNLNKEYIVYYLQREGNPEKSVLAAGYDLKLNTSGTKYIDVQDNEGNYLAQITDLPKGSKVTNQSYGKGEKNISVYRNGSLIASGADAYISTSGTNYIDIKDNDGNYLGQATDLKESDIITIDVK